MINNPELIDFVDWTGNVIKFGADRNDARRYDDAYMQIVIAAVFNSIGEVNVHERAPGKSHEGETDLICGGVASGETPEEAIRREINEEGGGIVVSDLMLVRKGINEYGRYCWLFTGKSEDTPNPKLVDPLEVVSPRVESLKNLEDGRGTLVMGLANDVRQSWEAINKS